MEWPVSRKVKAKTNSKMNAVLIADVKRQEVQINCFVRVSIDKFVFTPHIWGTKTSPTIRIIFTRFLSVH